MRSLFGWLAALLAVAISAAPVVAGDARLAQCWSPAELAAVAGESRPRLHVRAAGRIAAPNIPLAAPLPVEAAMQGSIRHVRLAGDDKLIALTFDLCEAGGEVAGYDGPIVDTLRASGVAATFFAGGKWMMSHPERARQLMATANFEVGSHNWSHGNMRLLSPAHALAELRRAEAAYEAQRAALAGEACLAAGSSLLARLPAHVRLYRFPYGACTPEALKLVAAEGMLAIQWDVSMADPSPGASASMIVSRVMRSVRPGSIIIGHANGRGVHTAEAVARLIPLLRAKGYRFVTVSELLAAGTPEIAAGCYDQRPGDSERYGIVQRRRLKAGIKG